MLTFPQRGIRDHSESDYGSNMGVRKDVAWNYVLGFPLLSLLLLASFITA